MTHSANDYAADTLSITLETLDEAYVRAETDDEREAINKAIAAVEDARALVLEREEPTPTQQLLQSLQERDDA